MFASKSDHLAQEKAYAFLKEGITTLYFKPNQRLKSAEIADEVNVSRTPVREALGRLVQEGLVKRDDGWGYVVHGLSLQDILNLWRVREVLEIEAGIEALPRLGEAEIAELEACIEKAEGLYRLSRFQEFVVQNRQFYIALARMTGNDLLQQMLGMIHDRVRLVGSLIVNLHPPRAKELLIENRRIFNALRDRDPVELESALRAHINKSRDHVLRFVGGQSITAIDAISR